MTQDFPRSLSGKSLLCPVTLGDKLPARIIPLFVLRGAPLREPKYSAIHQYSFTSLSLEFPEVLEISPR
jgi:hypothetical protein